MVEVTVLNLRLLIFWFESGIKLKLQLELDMAGFMAVD